ncbi:5'-methylthioadenosine/S-adenosylhomocysteine nucleosidase [Deltaproteobacteria bacterium TL4]
MISDMENEKPILLFVAGDIELRSIISETIFLNESVHEGWCYYDDARIKVVHTGIGAMNAVCAAYSFIKAFQPCACLQLGLSGAHRPELKIGDIVIGKSVREFTRHTKSPTGEIIPRHSLIQKKHRIQRYLEYHADVKLVEEMQSVFSTHQLQFYQGILGGGDQFNRDPQFIHKIQKAYGTWCEDMESAAVAYAATRLNVPYLGIRVISNNELVPETQSNEGERFQEAAFLALQRIGTLILSHFNQEGTTPIHNE